jgi:hypothetical protein
MYGRELLYPDYSESAKETEPYASRDQYVNPQIQRMAKVSDVIRSNARENDVTNKRQYDKSTNERIFQAGDHVLYFQLALARKDYSKLARVGSSASLLTTSITSYRLRQRAKY